MSNSNIDGILDSYYDEALNENWERAKAKAKQAIQQLLDEAYKKGYIDGGIAEITK